MAVGIICEYNPFHNGHVHHINKVKEMFAGEPIVLVMSSTFLQRGEVSIINKWDKTDIALNYVDLVVELPFAFSSQSADIFASGAIQILASLGVDKLVFGSESNDVDFLYNIVKTQDTDNYNNLVKEYLNQGINYPTAMSKALETILGKTVSSANDLLGISYIKCIYKNNYNITPYTILRTNGFHDIDSTSNIMSASGIRKLLKENKDISNYVPECSLNKINNISLEDYYSLIKYKILSSKDLSIYQTVDEGFDKCLKDNIMISNSIEELINNVKTKRYTYNRINRMLVHILCDFTKSEANNLKTIKYIRILGFNEIGKKYLNSIKKDIIVPLITGYSDIKSNMLDLEYRVTSIYSLKDNKVLELECRNKPIIK